MLSGKWLAGPYSDQLTAGLPFRGWGAEWWRRLGHVPLWNPEIFGGMPYVGVLGTGDILYPTALLRLALPTATVINLGFFLHYVLAGVFTYLFLRRLRVSWSGAVVGGLAYQLSGLVASYAQPGHDAKLAVTAFLPLALLGLVMGMRERRVGGGALVALAVGLSILTQHVQVTYYMLIAAGLFALYLTFDAPGPLTSRLALLGLALAAVVVGFGVAAVQLLPAFVHLPLSPRATGLASGFEGSTSYAIPWVHVPEFFLQQFVGWGASYWGSNPLKLHSEYLGLPVVALAILGAGQGQDRRLRLWLGGIGLLFLLISLGAGTPFYRIWWALMPYVKQMRAPGMAFFVDAFVVSAFAAFGVARLERDGRVGKAHVRAWFIVAGAAGLLAAAGAFSNMANALAESRQAAVHPKDITLGALTSAIALAAVAAITWSRMRGRLPPVAWGLGLAAAIGGDLWINARPFWVYSDAHRELYRADAVTERIRATPAPTRALDLGVLVAGSQSVYPGAVLMALDVPQLLGVHGLEIRYFDDVLGGRNVWRNLGNVHLWDLFAVRWVITPANVEGLDSIPGFARVLKGVPTSAGAPADLFERRTPAPYVRIVPAAVKLDSARIVATIPDPRMAYDRVVLLDARDPFAPASVTEVPPVSAARATVTHWEPGRMSITLDPAPLAASYALVAENWYPDWHATVDGAPAPVLRGDWTLITIPVPAGATRVELTFRSRAFDWGKAITLVSLVLVLGAVVGPAALRRRGA
jgi:hypothetical protein